MSSSHESTVREPFEHKAAVPRTRPPLAVAFGGGGLFGIAYAFGVADALAAAGVPLREAPSVGTSAGAWVASAVALGVPFHRLCELPPLRVPNPRPGALRAIAAEAFGDARHSRVLVSVTRLPRLSREILSGDRHPLAELVAASSSVPGLFPPSAVGGRLCLDGGIRSMVSADRAPGADALLVVSPLTAPLMGPVGRTLDWRLGRETARWSDTHGAPVMVIRPTAGIARMVRTPRDLFDLRRAKAVYPLAYRQARQLLQWGELGDVYRPLAPTGYRFSA